MYTVLGSSGFIGSNITEYLTSKGELVYSPKRGDNQLFNQELGTIIYSVGYGQCEEDPHNVLEANCEFLSEILKKASFEKIIYLSSTRVYMKSDSSMENSDNLILDDDKRSLFNLTKLVGEQLCRLSGKEYIIIRPSNVYGLALNSPLFLPTITKNAIINNKIDMYVSPDYEKDYVSVEDLAGAIYNLSKLDRAIGNTFNIASNKNIKAREIVDILENETGCTTNWHDSKNSVIENFPVTNISKLEEYVDFRSSCLLSDLKKMIRNFREELQ